jgi:hypothetical protein
MGEQQLSLPRGLRYYVLRDIVMVPLIPADQLPFQLQGIPRQLSHRQLSDEGWKFLVETSEAASTLSVRTPTTFSLSHPGPMAKAPYLAPDHYVRNEPHTTAPGNPRPDHRRRSPSVTDLTQATRELPAPSLTDSPTSIPDNFASIYPKDAQRFRYPTPYPSGIEPEPWKKEYCTHWIRSGECAFMSVGCKYKHEMPPVDKLHELGFTQGLPLWWKQKSAIGPRPPTWMQSRLAKGDDAEQRNEMPARREVPNPASWKAKADQHGTSNGVMNPSRSIPPPKPIQMAVRPRSPVVDLLIDFDDSPGPPPSPQFSDASSISVVSANEPNSSSRSSASPPLSTITHRDVVEGKATSATKDNKKVKEAPRLPLNRRQSLVPWAFESEEDVPPIKKHKQNYGIDKKTKRAFKAQQHGLAHSKHAAGDIQGKNEDDVHRDNIRRGKPDKNAGSVVNRSTQNVQETATTARKAGVQGTGSGGGSRV